MKKLEYRVFLKYDYDRDLWWTGTINSREGAALMEKWSREGEGFFVRWLTEWAEIKDDESVQKQVADATIDTISTVTTRYHKDMIAAYKEKFNEVRSRNHRELQKEIQESHPASPAQKDIMLGEFIFNKVPTQNKTIPSYLRESDRWKPEPVFGENDGMMDRKTPPFILARSALYDRRSHIRVRRIAKQRLVTDDKRIGLIDRRETDRRKK